MEASKCYCSFSMTENTTVGKWEKRWHPLREEWVVYAAHRNNRPWTTGTLEREQTTAPEYDPTCYLCPGNGRIHGDVNPDYKGVYVFDNDHPVVGLAAPEVPEEATSGLYRKAPAKGIARVVCYDPRHNVTLSDVSDAVVFEVLNALKQETIKLAAVPEVHHVFIFENKGKECGVSNPHPHCQIYATDFTIKAVDMHLKACHKHRQLNGTNLFQDILTAELQDGGRVLAENELALAFIPFFARYAYEVMIMPKQHYATLLEIPEQDLAAMAEVYALVMRMLDMNAGHTFPYVMSLQQAQVKDTDQEYWLHIQLLPPYRAPGLLKHLAGPEAGGSNFMADTMPEEKAAELKRWLPQAQASLKAMKI